MAQASRVALVLGIASLVAGTAGAQSPLSTAFSYQGRLGDNGTPANGAYDFQFVLFNAPGGGSPVGPTVTVNDLFVAQGLFTATLDFGNAFTGNRGWLEIGVRPGASTGGYSVFGARQELTATPVSLYSTVTPWTGVSGKPAGFADNVDNDVLGGLACPAGQVPKVTGSSWTCGTDLNTTYTAAAGGGLQVLSTTQFAIASGGVTSAMVLDNSLTSSDLATDSVGLAEIQNNAVSGTKISDGTITSVDIANNTVGTDKITNGTITVFDLDTANVDARYLETDELLTGTNYGGCGTYALLPCNGFIPGTQAPACNVVPVGGICRVSSAGSVCPGTIGGTCGDLATYYLKITP